MLSSHLTSYRKSSQIVPLINKVLLNKVSLLSTSSNYKLSEGRELKNS